MLHQRKNTVGITLLIAMSVIFLLVALEIFLSGRAQLVTVSGGMRFVRGTPAILMGLCSMCVSAATGSQAAGMLWQVRVAQFTLARNTLVVIGAASLLLATVLAIAQQFR